MFRKIADEARSLRKEVAARRELMWDWSDQFDRDCSNDWELWEQLTEEAQELYAKAIEVSKTDAVAALELYEEGAAAGNPLAMGAAGLFHASGLGTPNAPDKAIEFYDRAMEAGSWSALVCCARFRQKLGQFEEAEYLLKQGIEADYTAALFWLAWYRYARNPTRKTARSVWSMVQTALERGHPGARWMAARLLMRGKLGIHRILEGWRIQCKLSGDLGEELEALGQSEIY